MSKLKNSTLLSSTLAPLPLINNAPLPQAANDEYCGWLLIVCDRLVMVSGDHLSLNLNSGGKIITHRDERFEIVDYTSPSKM